MRACHTNNCPVGIATQKPHLRARLPVDEAAERLARFFGAVGRADAGAGPRLRPRPPRPSSTLDDLTTWNRDMAHLTGVAYGGRRPL